MDSSETRAWLAVPGCAIVVANRDGVVQWASPSCRKVIGHDAATLLGADAWHVLVAPGDIPHVAAAHRALDEGDVVAGLRYLRPDGTRAWYRVFAGIREGSLFAAVRREYEAETATWYHRAATASDLPGPV